MFVGLADVVAFIKTTVEKLPMVFSEALVCLVTDPLRVDQLRAEQ